MNILILTKPTWSKPKKTQIAIFDLECERFLAPNLAMFEFTSIPVRGEQTNYYVLSRAIFRLNFWHHPFACYVYEYIRLTQASICITTTHTSKLFWQLSNSVINMKTIMLQNGIIDDFIHTSKSGKYFIDHILVFSESHVDYFKNHFSGEVSVFGSLRNNMCEIQMEKTNDVIWISTWVDGHTDDETFKLANGQYVRYSDFNGCEATAIAYVGEWCKKNGLCLSIAGSTLNDYSAVREKDFFQNVFQNYPEIEWEYFPRRGLSNYGLLDKHKMVASIDSALAFEALGRGAKVAFISWREEMFCLDDRRFGYPSELPLEGPFWTRSTLKNELFDFLSDVYLTNMDHYQRNAYAYKEILVPHNYGNTKLLDLIYELLMIKKN